MIVPVHRHWHLLPALLDVLRAQALAEPLEILIVNNDAPTPPPPLDLPPNARILPCTTPGSYAARNIGAAAARGRLFAFTDADCRPAPGWLAALAEAAEATPEMLLAGPVAMQPPPDPNAFAIYDLVRGIPQARYVRRGYATTANLSVPAALFRRLGGFDPARRSGGDADFCRRAGRAGHGIRLVEDAVVTHPCRDDWAALVTKARRIKGGQIRAGPLPRRMAWVMRTLSPPIRDTRAYLASPHPWRIRRTAIAVRLRLWGVELAETLRLLGGAEPERR